MEKSYIHTIKSEASGQFTLPQHLVEQLCLVDGGKIRIEVTESGMFLSHSTSGLRKVYIEVTNGCNLGCRTCMRNAWKEPLGRMTWETFTSIIEGFASFSPTPLLFFGGFGEPLSHPDISRMIATAVKEGIKVEIITNGTLLTETLIRQFIDYGVQRIWVSIDGASRESYTDIRLGDSLPLVLNNLSVLQQLLKQSNQSRPKIGIAFVAMRRNIQDLPEVIRLGKRLGADRFSVSNVFPHTLDLLSESLYPQSMYQGNLQPSAFSPVISLPRMDLDIKTVGVLGEILSDRNQLQITRQLISFGINRCPFAERGSLAIRWDGEISPCLPLLHTHENYLAENHRISHAYSFGNVNEDNLYKIWEKEEYRQFRERLLDFDFSPCTFCNSCYMADANLEDCFGNSAPACGGCLWAQGFIQCP